MPQDITATQPTIDHAMTATASRRAGEPRPLRVLVGTHEIARQLHDIGDGLRKLGHEVTTVARRHHRLYPGLPYDHVIDRDPRDERSSLPSLLRHVAHRAGVSVTRTPLSAWIRNHDIFVFLWGSSLLPGNLDLPLLRRLGKTVLCLFLGSDIRHWSAAEQYRAEIGLGTYDGYRGVRSLDRAVRALRMAELHADACFFQPSYAELAIAPYMHLYLAIDLSMYRFAIPGREVPVVVHAPSRREIKGTSDVLAAAEQLRREGLRFDMRLLEEIPNPEVLAHLTDADVVVDELNESHYGMLALEAMASGCAVLGGNRTDVVPMPAKRPVVHVTPATVLEELRSLVTDRERRTRLAAEGRIFVERYHNHPCVARTLLDGSHRARRGDFDYRPTWFADRYVLPKESSLTYRNRILTSLVARRCGLEERALASLHQRGLA